MRFIIAESIGLSLIYYSVSEMQARRPYKSRHFESHSLTARVVVVPNYNKHCTNRLLSLMPLSPILAQIHQHSNNTLASKLLYFSL